ncbi:MAG: aromatic amino acid transaminase [Pseudomonadota bacterium]
MSTAQINSATPDAASALTAQWNDTPQAVDPIIALMQTYTDDVRPERANLGIGVYQDDLAETPVMASVKEAEERILAAQRSKTYVGIGGDPALVKAIGDEIFAPSTQWTGVQGVGGSGALRLIAEFCGTVSPDARLWVSDPTWGNHFALFDASGLEVRRFPWGVHARDGIVDRALDALASAKPGDFVILHACCHNPTGIDLPPEEERRLTDAINGRGLIPIIDAAYVGFADGFEIDAQALGALAAQFPLAFVAFSASKNFALYRERVGVAFITGADPARLADWQTILLSAARCAYSMPPDHGAASVLEILRDPALRGMWLDELEAARSRVARLRKAFASALEEEGTIADAHFIAAGTGLFSLLPLTREQVIRLRTDHAIYMLENGRVNIAGLREESIPRVVSAISAVAST